MATKKKDIIPSRRSKTGSAKKRGPGKPKIGKGYTNPGWYKADDGSTSTGKKISSPKRTGGAYKKKVKPVAQLNKILAPKYKPIAGKYKKVD